MRAKHACTWQAARDFAACRSRKARQCRRPTVSPVAHAVLWLYSSEVEHLLSHGKSANPSLAEGQTAGMYTPCFAGMNNGRPTRCAVREEKKRICRSPRQMRLLLMSFFACYFT